ncbi:MAG: DedA family protein [Aeromonas sp.]|uniref:DedA family protein n=1 Tax=Aeromonas salmonicida TaxID=645 RepID=UPI00145B0746|nr:DedA family protein [Aeromonas salmonicida]MBP6361072.1 DedA family protein [Aeromonas sp.]MBP8223923.1 DedA family protein [Aeromonas sp.]
MEQFYQLAHAFMHQDLVTLSDPKMAFMVCGVLLTFLVLENGFIPTAFLPGDSLLILTGVLIYQDVLSLSIVPLLILATFVGTWLGYMQGRFLGHTQMYHRLLSHVEERHKEKVFYLLDKYGILTLITARYIAFVRTAYPYIVGATEIPQGRFLIVNLISSIMWICPLVGLGYYLSHTKLAAQYESQFLSIILYLPLVLLLGGIVALLWRWLSKRKAVLPRE